jgi:hypothetical protein
LIFAAAGLAGSDWSYGGAILTFVFPELLFIFVAGALYVAYTMPHPVPGYRQEPVRPRLTARSATATPGVQVPRAAGGEPSAGEPSAGGGTPADGGPAAGPGSD